MDVHGWVCILLFHHCTLTPFPVLRVCDILGVSPWLRSFGLLPPLRLDLSGSFGLPSSLSVFQTANCFACVEESSGMLFLQQRGWLFRPSTAFTLLRLIYGEPFLP